MDSGQTRKTRQVEARFYPGHKGTVSTLLRELASERGWQVEGEPVTALAAHGAGVSHALARDTFPPLVLLADGLHSEEDALRLADLAERGTSRVVVWASRSTPPSLEGLRVLAQLLPPRVAGGRVYLGPVLVQLVETFEQSGRAALLPVARLPVSA